MTDHALLLVRHGQASFGAEDYDRLSPKGEQQARRLGAWLAATQPSPELVAQGTLRRHQRTADLCLEAAGIDAPRLELPELDELDHVELLRRHRPDLESFAALREEMGRQPDPMRAFQDLFVAAVERWAGGKHDGEYALSWPAFRARVLAALDTLNAHPASRIWAFTSGGPIAVMANAVLGAPPERTFTLSWPLVNTSLTRLAMRADGPRLVGYNAWPHLEAPECAGLVTHR